MNHWVFDFDGVLARSLENEIRLCKELHGWDQTNDQIHKRIVDYFSKTELSRRDNVTQKHIDTKSEFIRSYTEYVLSVDNEIFHDFIRASISVQPSRFAVVSSGGERYINKFLEPYKEYFEYIYGFETHHSKEEKIERIATHWGVEAAEITYFTDTIADVLELRELIGLDNIYGCSWGWCGHENLQKVLPDQQILVNFTDVLNI